MNLEVGQIRINEWNSTMYSHITVYADKGVSDMPSEFAPSWHWWVRMCFLNVSTLSTVWRICYRLSGPCPSSDYIDVVAASHNDLIETFERPIFSDWRLFLFKAHHCDVTMADPPRWPSLWRHNVSSRPRCEYGEVDIVQEFICAVFVWSTYIIRKYS